MINIDTNIILRVVKTDPDFPGQSDKARHYVQSAWDAGDTLFLTSTVLIESCWVLKSRYKTPKAGIVEFVESLLALDQTELEYPTETAQALASYKKGKGDFSDYMIAHIAKSHGCDVTWTFDKMLTEKSLFAIKKSG